MHTYSGVRIWLDNKIHAADTIFKVDVARNREQNSTHTNILTI